MVLKKNKKSRISTHPRPLSSASGKEGSFYILFLNPLYGLP
jgi:hypothetical protein